MQAVIQTLESMVLALAVAAFAHFGVALKDCPCPKAHAAVHRVSYASRAPAPLAKDLRRA